MIKSYYTDVRDVNGDGQTYMMTEVFKADDVRKLIINRIEAKKRNTSAMSIVAKAELEFILKQLDRLPHKR